MLIQRRYMDVNEGSQVCYSCFLWWAGRLILLVPFDATQDQSQTAAVSKIQVLLLRMPTSYRNQIADIQQPVCSYSKHAHVATESNSPSNRCDVNLLSHDTSFLGPLHKKRIAQENSSTGTLGLRRNVWLSIGRNSSKWNGGSSDSVIDFRRDITTGNVKCMDISISLQR